MAILNDIRKHGIFLIIIIALALFAFVLSGVVGNGNTPKGESAVATINGVELPREDFMKKVEATQRNLGPNSRANQAMDIVWNQELRRIILEEQYEALGLSAEGSQIGNSLRSTLANSPNFQGETGQFSEAKLQGYLASIKERADSGDSRDYNAWMDYEKNIANSVLEQNYFNLIKGGLITTLAEGEQEYHFQNDNVNIDYVYIPYTKIADEDVTVSDSEIKAYVKAHSGDYEVEPQVDIQYVSFNEDPSAEDEAVAKQDVAKLSSAFETTTDIPEFVNANAFRC